MPSNRLQNETARSLAFFSRASTQLRPSALFRRPRHIRLQQQRTFRWFGTSRLRQAAQEQGIHALEDARRESEADGNEWETTQENDKAVWKARKQESSWEDEAPYKTVQAAQRAVTKALSQQVPSHEMLFVFSRAAQCPGYLETVPDTLLKVIMELIKPETLLVPFRAIHRHIHTASLDRFKHRTLEKIFDAYTAAMRGLLPTKGESLEELASWKLKHLIRIAAITGDARRANILFGLFNRLPGRTIDLDTCNKMLQALCWSDAYFQSERHQLRVNQATLAARDTGDRSRSRGSKKGYKVGSRGIKDQALSVIQRMNSLYMEPDAESWAYVVLALAREGDIESVKTTIRRVWDVDTDAVLRQDESGLLFENRLPPDSPNFPTSDTLFTIAHAFCVNGEVATALQVVEFLSRKYNVSIQEDTLTELLEWSYVYSSPQSGRKAVLEEKLRTDRFAADFVKKLGEMIQSPPYNLKINSRILLYLFKNSIRRGSLVEALDLMEQMHELRKQSMAVYSQMQARRPDLAPADLEMELLDAKRIRDLEQTRAFFQDLLSSKASKRLRLSWQEGSSSQRQAWWYHRTLPDLIGKYPRYSVRSGNAYSIPEGRIQFLPSWQQTSVALESGESPFPGVRLFQTRVLSGEDAWLGLSRQVRLQLRHAKRGASAGGGPRWNPAWFEREEVTNWRPIRDEEELPDAESQLQPRETKPST